MWLGDNVKGPYVLFFSKAAYAASLKELGSHEAIERWYKKQYGVDVTVKVTRPMPTKRQPRVNQYASRQAYKL